MEHDIRTPLSGIEGLAALLDMTETDPERKSCLTGIIDCVHELLSYCNSILDFSQISQGTLPLLDETFSVRAILGKIMAIERPAAKMKNLDLTMTVTGDLPERIIGDPRRLQQILINLVSNAIKFTHQGGIYLSIQQEQSPDDREVYIAFSIKDTGIGIARDKHEVIYEKFSRLWPANSGEYPGLGLGLQIVKQFITEMRGTITLDSEPGKGSTFTCRLPFRVHNFAEQKSACDHALA
jgi:signal transduction histidine kinase